MTGLLLGREGGKWPVVAADSTTRPLSWETDTTRHAQRRTWQFIADTIAVIVISLPTAYHD